MSTTTLVSPEPSIHPRRVAVTGAATILWLKRLGLAALAVLVAGALVYALRPLPVGIDVATLSRGELRVTVDEEGKTRIRDVYIIAAPISGKVLRSPLHVGDTVVAGETEAAAMLPTAPPLLDTRMQQELEAMVSAARSAITVAEGEVAQAQSEAAMAASQLKRTRELASKGFATKRSLDQAETEAAVRKAAVARAQSVVQMRQEELRSAQARLTGNGETTRGKAPAQQPISVKVPASGRVLRLLVESEAPVQQGAPLVEIGDAADMEVVVDLLSTDAVKVAIGAEAVVEGWGGTEPLTAKVKAIEPRAFTKVSALGIEEQRVRTVLELSQPPEPRPPLGHEYRVFVRILAWHAPDALRMPLGALFRQGDGWAVFTTDGTTARLRRVTLGHRNPDFAEVLSGLTAGDRVILHPSDRVTDGAAVEIRQQETAAGVALDQGGE